jgi:hypothetical protein
VRGALLFDLDETLMVEEPAAVEAFAATALVAAACHDVDVEALAVAARSHGTGALVRVASPRVLPASRHQLVGGPVVPVRGRHLQARAVAA